MHIKIIAHRGNSSEAPENTKAAFDLAINCGVDFLECDVQMTKDDIPVIIHEQNSVAGLTNKILARFATYVLVAFAGVLPGKRTMLVGNPVRADIAQLLPPIERYMHRQGKLNILIVGGSLGAQALNEIIPKACAKLSNINQVTHQVGRGDAAAIGQMYQDTGINAKVVNFIDDMADAYATNDLIICRAGASTVSEVCVAGIAAIFIPYPYAVDNHQFYNAKGLVDHGSSYLIVQKDLDVAEFSKLIEGLDRNKCMQMATLVRQLAISDSCERIVAIITKCIV